MATKKPAAKARKPAAAPKTQAPAQKPATARKSRAKPIDIKLDQRASKLANLAKGRQGGAIKAKKSGKALAGEVNGVEKDSGPSLDVSKLPIKWQVFVEEYLIDLNGTQAAIRSGYMASDAASRACKILADPRMAAIVRARIDEKIEAVRMTRDRVLDAYADIAEADANELSEHRRVCCRYCYGEFDETTSGHVKQMTPADFMRKRERWEERRQEILAENPNKDIGEFAEEPPATWYDKRRPINPTCPECFGDGVGEVVLKDTRTLSRRARVAYQGTEEGKDGIKIKSVTRGEALTVLAKHHRIFDDSPTVTVNFDAAELDAKFGDAMRKSSERMTQMREDRAAAREKRGD